MYHRRGCPEDQGFRTTFSVRGFSILDCKKFIGFFASNIRIIKTGLKLIVGPSSALSIHYLQTEV